MFRWPGLDIARVVGGSGAEEIQMPPLTVKPGRLGRYARLPILPRARPVFVLYVVALDL